MEIEVLKLLKGKKGQIINFTKQSKFSEKKVLWSFVIVFFSIQAQRVKHQVLREEMEGNRKR